MADQEQRVVCVHAVPVGVDEIRQVVELANFRDPPPPAVPAEGADAGLPPVGFRVRMRDGSWAEAVYPSFPEIADEHVAEAVERRLDPFLERHATAWHERGLDVQAAHPPAVGPEPADFLVGFADFERMAEGRWQPDVPPDPTGAQMDDLSRLMELANLLRP